MRIAIIDTSTTRAAIISEGLREAGLDDLVLIDNGHALVAQIEAANPEVVLINLENPSRDVLEEYFAVSRALARPIAMFVDLGWIRLWPMSWSRGGLAALRNGFGRWEGSRQILPVSTSEHPTGAACWERRRTRLPVGTNIPLAQQEAA